MATPPTASSCLPFKSRLQEPKCEINVVEFWLRRGVFSVSQISKELKQYDVAKLDDVRIIRDRQTSMCTTLELRRK